MEQVEKGRGLAVADERGLLEEIGAVGPRALSLVAVAAPAVGSATIVSGQVAYQPPPGWLGVDDFA